MTNSSTEPRSQADREFTRMKFEFQERVAADRALPGSASSIAVILAKHFNRHKDGAAWPSMETLAKETGFNLSTVSRTLRRMEKRGHIRAQWAKRGRGPSSRYFMAVPRSETSSELLTCTSASLDLHESKRFLLVNPSINNSALRAGTIASQCVPARKGFPDFEAENVGGQLAQLNRALDQGDDFSSERMQAWDEYLGQFTCCEYDTDDTIATWARGLSQRLSELGDVERAA